MFTADDMKRLQEITMEIIVLQDHALDNANRINDIQIKALRWLNAPKHHGPVLTELLEEATAIQEDNEKIRGEVLGLSMEASSLSRKMTQSLEGE